MSGPTPQVMSHYPAPPPPVRLSLVTLPGHACPYLPGRSSVSRAFWAGRVAPRTYHRLMDANFRRSGRLVYQPACRGCRACQSIRVPVATFKPDKGQRRCRRRNQDLLVTRGEPEPTDEKFELYRRYQVKWHGKDEREEDRESFESFLYDSPVQTSEFCYRDGGGRLLAVGICDVAKGLSLSSVYFYYDPDESRRGLGTFGALHEIETAARDGIPYYYLGYWVGGCRAMQYKAGFRPSEVLCSDGVWRPGPTA